MRAAHGLVIVLSLTVGVLVWILLPGEGPRGMEDPARPDRGCWPPSTGRCLWFLWSGSPEGLVASWISQRPGKLWRF
jgi:hypothetical protein